VDALVARGYDDDVDRSGDPDSQAERDGCVVLFGRDDCESFASLGRSDPGASF
jgi:hypothetical protein